MAHQAIYRKWRPMIFEDIVGQSHITNTLKKQITTGRIGHAYLFCGTRGTGKTTSAKIFARAVNCLSNNDGSPCNECDVCKGIIDGSILDVNEIDAASNNGVDNIREIKDDAQYAATNAKYTVYIIDEVHMLSQVAFNALLKTLEEPPEHVIFILATTEPHKVPQTILSRCQRFDFRRITPSDIIVRMKQIAHEDGFDLDDSAYMVLSRLADGSMRDGLSLLERVVSSCSGPVTANDINNILGLSDLETSHNLMSAIIDGSADELLFIIDEVLSQGKDLRNFIDSFIKYLRDLLVIKVSSAAAQSLDYSQDELVNLRANANKLTFEKISHATSVLSDAHAEAKWLKSPRVVYEMALLKLAKPEIDQTPEGILDKLSSIEQNISSPQTVDTSGLERRIKYLEEKLKNGIFTAPDEKSLEGENKEEKKEVAKRLYSPIAKQDLHSNNPLVKVAKNWGTTVNSILKSHPYLTGSLLNRDITIDNDGILLLYNDDEDLVRKLAQNYISKIQSEFEKSTGLKYTVKVAKKSDLDADCFIDVWALLPPSSSQDVSEPSLSTSASDSLAALTKNFSEIVDSVDEREFLDYDTPQEEQSELAEEFLTEEEMAINDED